MTGGSATWLVLDVDDTLVATFRVGLRKCRETARRLRLRPPTEQEFTTVYGRMSFAACVAELHPGVDLTRYAAVYDSLAPAYPAEPLCDIGPLLAAAESASIGIGVLTNGPGDKTVRKLAALGLSADDFAFIRHAGNSAVAKPDPAAFTGLAAALGTDPARVWYVSDSSADWAGCRRVGLRAVGVTAGRWAGCPIGEVPELLVTDVAALARLLPALEQLNGERPTGPAPDAVSFDAGFTLVEHVRPAARVVADRLRQDSVPVDEASVAHAFAERIDRLADSERIWASDAEIIRVLLGLYEDVVEAVTGRPDRTVAAGAVADYTTAANWRVRPGAARALDRVRPAFRSLGVLANWQSTLGDVLAATGLAERVNVILPSALIGAGKPDQVTFRTMARALGSAEDRLVHVGDDLTADVAGALRAGCRAVHVPQDAPEQTLLRTVEVIVS